MKRMFRSSKAYMPTYVIIAVNIAIYIYTSILSGNFVEMNYGVVCQYGQFNSFVLNGGYWQLFTSMFVHVNIVHLLGNMVFLLIFGLRAEGLFKIEEYLAVYFIPGLSGSLLTLLFGPLAPPSAGASGAIFGLFGACTIYVRRTVGQSIIGALIYSFFLLMMSTGPNVNNLAHLGGLAVGLLIGYILARKKRFQIVYSYSHYIG